MVYRECTVPVPCLLYNRDVSTVLLYGRGVTELIYGKGVPTALFSRECTC